MNRNSLPRINKQPETAGARRPTVATEERCETRQSAGQCRPTKVRLTDRCKQLNAVLAVARYFSNSQITKLFFSGRSPKTMRKRLLRLAGEGRSAFSPPYLRRLFYRAYAGGERVEIWATAPRGHATARSLLGTELKMSRNDIGAAFREHTIALNELLVALYAPTAKGYARAKQDAFRWHSSDCVRLPWKEYAAAEDRSLERVVLPDAILEIPRLKRRLFLECETGTHSIIATGNGKPGATLSKVERYESFLRDFADDDATRTFYKEKYSDGWTPEVLFVVNSSSRDRLALARRARGNRKLISHTAECGRPDGATTVLQRRCDHSEGGAGQGTRSQRGSSRLSPTHQGRPGTDRAAPVRRCPATNLAWCFG